MRARQGELGDTFYIVIDGRCAIRVYDKNQEVDVTVGFIRSGGSFGELALRGAGEKRQATVVCTSTCHLLKLQKEDYNRILRAADERVTAERVRFLRRVQLGLFADFSDAALEELASTMVTRTFEKNRIIVRQGSSCDEMFIIIRGEVRPVGARSAPWTPPAPTRTSLPPSRPAGRALASSPSLTCTPHHRRTIAPAPSHAAGRCA